MKTKIILGLTAALLAAASARAEVVIYKGVIRNTGDFNVQTASPRTINLFLAVDYSQQQVGLVEFYANAPGIHSVEGIPGDIHITTALLVGGKSATLLSSGSAADNGPGDYSQSVTFLRGTNATVTVATIPSPAQRNLQRAILGNSTVVSASGGAGDFSLGSFGFTQDLKKTTDANNAGRTIQQAMDDIAAGLKKIGYAP